MNKKTKQFLKYSIAFVLASIFMLLLITGIIGYFYGDKVANLIIKELNKKIKTELKVDNVLFSALKKFPNATVELQNVKIKSSGNFSKNQFKESVNKDFIIAKRVFLSFSLVDIFNDIYRIKWLEIEEATINILNDSKNRDNYHFWNETTNNESNNDELKSQFKLILQNVQIKNSQFNYYDKFNNFSTSSLLKDCEFSGNFAKTSFDLEVQSDIFIKSLTYDKIHYIENKAFNAEFNLSENNGNYAIKEVFFQLNQLDLYFNSRYNSNSEVISFRLKGYELDYSTFLKTVPNTYSHLLPETEKSGELDFDLSYQNGQKSYLIIEKLKIEIGNSSLNLKANFQSLDNPTLQLEAKTELELSEFSHYISKTFEIDSLLTKTGKINAQIEYKGKFNSNFQFGYTEGSFLKGELKIDNLESVLNKEKISINSMISFTDNLLEIKNLKADYLSSSFDFRGKSTNLFDFLANKSTYLDIEGDLKSQNLNFNDFISTDSLQMDSMQTEEIQKKKQTELAFWQKVRLNVFCEIQKLSFNNFEATNLKTQIKGNSKSLFFNATEMKSMSGKIKGNYELKLRDNSLNIRSQNSVFTNLDIKKAFLSFDNFWQSSLLAENINGIVNSTNLFSIYFDYDFNMLYDKNLIHAKIKLQNGSLINFKPLESMSSFVKIKELNKITFSELENEFFMKNSIVTLPEMNLNSQIVNMSISGEYSMLGEYQFSLKVGLYSFLANKLSKRREIIKDSKAKLGIYLLFSGNDETYNISYDKNKIHSVLKENSEYTKKEISLLLENEYLNKDTTIISKKAVK